MRIAPNLILLVPLTWVEQVSGKDQATYQVANVWIVDTQDKTNWSRKESSSTNQRHLMDNWQHTHAANPEKKPQHRVQRKF